MTVSTDPGSRDNSMAGTALLAGRLECTMCDTGMRHALVRGRNCYVCDCPDRAVLCADLDVLVLGMLYDRRRAAGDGSPPVSLRDEPRLIGAWVVRVVVGTHRLTPQVTWAATSGMR